MTSTVKTAKANDNNLELNQAQLNTLVATLGASESKVREIYEAMRYKYPNGSVTEEEFVKSNTDESVENEPRLKNFLKFLFATIDYDHSGKIDIYEHLLTAGLLGSYAQDPDTVAKCLFQLCDSNHDGLLTKNEIANIVYMFVVKLELNGEDKPANPKDHMEHIMSIVNKAFGDKTQLSEQEFRNIIANNEEIQELANNVHAALVTGLSVITRPEDSD